jgi:8-oxo-dGTP pyrophosphatase MutT (NUDIX family)
MENFVSQVSEKLKQNLPGNDAHEVVRPRLLSGQAFELKSQPNPRKGAVLILFYPESDRIYFPLIQRPNYEGVHGGQIGLPGGKYEDSDQDLIHTALRESHEEIGVHPDNVNVIGALSEYYVAASNHLILPVVGYALQKPDFVPDHIEVAEVIEAPVDRLRDPKSLKEKEMTIRGFSMITPYYDLQNKVVWGATAAMLSELRAVVSDISS